MSATDFYLYCRQLTDNQLRNVLKKEYDASRTDAKRLGYYHAALAQARVKGWMVVKGVVQ